MSDTASGFKIEFPTNLEFRGQSFFEDAQHVASISPGGWMRGIRHDISYGEDAPRALVQEGLSGGILPFRLMMKSVDGELTDRFPAQTVDVAVFGKTSGEREYSRTVHDHFGPIALPLFETRVKRVLRGAEKRLGRLASNAS